MERKEYKIAIYLRISKEDEKEKESTSIPNQRSLLIRFIQSQNEFNGWEILEFSDDGYSGITMNRPALNQLFKQIKEGKIVCVIVKDFSRFSRDYIELGTYIEQIFPFLGVRFISLNNHYDSAKKAELNLESAFQNLLYDWYTKDLSIKVKSSLMAKKEKGCYLSTRPPYGYKKDKIHPYHVVICKEEAEVVRSIFSFALEGKTLYEIAKLLNQKGILTQTTTAFHPVLWRAGTIDQILKNPFYTGTMVYHKYEKKQFDGKTHRNTEEEWKQIFHHHPAIIEQDLFEEVQNRYRKKKKKETIQRKPYLMAGKLRCGICQKKLQIRNTKTPYFTCTTRYITESEYCVKKLEIDRIMRIVTQIFWKIILFYQLEKKIEILKKQIQKQESETLEKRKKEIEKELEKWKKKKRILYQKYRVGEIEKEEYFREKRQQQIQEEEWEKKKNLQQKKYNKIPFILKENEFQTKEEKEKEIQESAENSVKKILVWEGKKLVIFWDFQEPV